MSKQSKAKKSKVGHGELPPPSYETVTKDLTHKEVSEEIPEETVSSRSQKSHRKLFRSIFAISIFFITSLLLSTICAPKLTGWILLFSLVGMVVALTTFFMLFMKKMSEKANTNNEEDRKCGTTTVRIICSLIAGSISVVVMPIGMVGFNIHKICKSSKELKELNESTALGEEEREEERHKNDVEKKIHLSLLSISICALVIPIIFIILCSANRDFQKSFRSFDLKHVADGMSKIQIVAVALFGVALLALIAISLLFYKKSVMIELEYFQELGKGAGMKKESTVHGLR